MNSRFKGKSKFTPKQIENFYKEGKCFNCRKEGHTAAQCPDKPSTSKGKEAEKPQGRLKPLARAVLDILGNVSKPKKCELLLAWGKIIDQ